MPKQKKPMANTATTAKKPAGKKPPALNRELRGKLGEQLRAMHDDVVKEGIPDRFKELLQRLDARNTDRD